MNGERGAVVRSRQSQNGALTLQALVSIALFSLAAMAILSLSVRQLLATRHAGEHLGRSRLLVSTLDRAQAEVYTLEPGVRALEAVEVDGTTYNRELEVSESSNPRTLEVIVRMWSGERSKARVWSYRKQLLKL